MRNRISPRFGAGMALHAGIRALGRRDRRIHVRRARGRELADDVVVVRPG